MSTAITYTPAAEKKVATYLDQMAQMKLGGHDNSYTRMMLNNTAVAALHQIMLDNEEATGYSATLEEIKREMAT